MNAGFVTGQLAEGQVKARGDAQRYGFFRRSQLRLQKSIVLCVLAPTLLASVYFGFIAADQYVAEARFAVRGMETPKIDVLGSLIGLPGSGNAVADTFIVQDFMRSREAIDAVGQQLGLRAIFNRPEGDWMARLGSDQSMEDFIDYWRQMVGVSYDSTSGIVTLTVRAFRSEDAAVVASGLLEAGEKLVNGLSDRARRDSLAVVEMEVQRAQKRLAEVRERVTRFRNQHQILDPARQAEAGVGLVSGLEEELAKNHAELGAIRGFMQSSAMRVLSLENRVRALKAQIDIERAKLARPSSEDTELMSEIIADYQTLLGEQEFAERAYQSALTSLEAARAEAMRQHRYLVTFVSPKIPEEAIRPRRIVSVLTVFGGAFLLWGIGALALAAIKDHAGWV